MKNSNNFYEDNRLIYMGVGILVGLIVLYLLGLVYKFLKKKTRKLRAEDHEISRRSYIYPPCNSESRSESSSESRSESSSEQPTEFLISHYNRPSRTSVITSNDAVPEGFSNIKSYSNIENFQNSNCQNRFKAKDDIQLVPDTERNRVDSYCKNNLRIEQIEVQHCHDKQTRPPNKEKFTECMEKVLGSERLSQTELMDCFSCRDVMDPEERILYRRGDTPEYTPLLITDRNNNFLTENTFSSFPADIGINIYSPVESKKFYENVKLPVPKVFEDIIGMKGTDEITDQEKYNRWMNRPQWLNTRRFPPTSSAWDENLAITRKLGKKLQEYQESGAQSDGPSIINEIRTRPNAFSEAVKTDSCGYKFKIPIDNSRDTQLNKCEYVYHINLD